MRLLGFALLFCGVVAFLASVSIFLDSNHMGSVIRIQQHFVLEKNALVPDGLEVARHQAIESVVSEGKHGYELLGRALVLLCAVGVGVAGAGVGVLLFYRRLAAEASQNGNPGA